MTSNQQAEAIALPSRISTFGHGLLFVTGFTLVFVIGWGGAATLLGQLFGQYKTLLGRIGGVVAILFGFVTIGLIRIPWLSVDTRPQLKRWGANRWVNSSLIGILFAAGWTPCVGTTLGAILTLGFSQETTYQAMLLSSGYAMGLGIPFLILALLLERSLGVVRKLGKYLRAFQWISGLLLIVIGLMMLTDRITYIAIWATKNGFYLDLPLGGAAAPTYIAAVAAGALSFLSPCVLPLVPAYLGYLSGQGLSFAKKIAAVET
jgi:cytochrome c-type biogenesis protein